TNIPCPGGNNGSVTATPAGGTSAYTYSWAPGGQTNATVTGLVAGTYTVTVTDGNGCTATVTAAITQPTVLTLTGFATDTAICKGNCTNVNATAGGGSPSYTYAWNTGATTSSVNVCPLVKTTYTVSLTDANGCTAAPVTVTVDVSSCLGINEVGSLDEQVKFYPNPFSQSVNVNVEVSGPVTVTMFNVMGQNVGAYTMNKGLNTINTSGMASGVYTVQVKTPSGIMNKKLVKVE
ncbi:MAG TPA: T9SS type A sorting domain-containing protein, partial [Bacteroidia bacterium]|nr:T9SS type A sorting domain-containing protein [Bacteroidia bacterium]